MQQATAATPGLEYARRLYTNVLAWYDNADRKAQLIITANGGFLTVLLGLGLSKASDVRETTEIFGPETWVFAGLAAASIVVAFTASAIALRSRLLSRQEEADALSRHGVDVDDPSTYDPSVIWFFQLVRHLEESTLEDRVAVLGPRQELDALVDQSLALSKRVTWKHRYVNIGFAAMSIALSLLVATAVSYTVRLAA